MARQYDPSEEPKGKSPSFPFYVRDWLSDTGIRSCSLAERGLWIELLCHMHLSPRRGFLLHGDGSILALAEVPTLVSGRTETVIGYLGALARRGVYSIEESTGAIYCRRMVKESMLSEVRKATGKLGGNPNLVKRTEKLGYPNCQPNRNQNPTPASASASSSSFASEFAYANSSHTIETTPVVRNPNGNVFDPENAFEELWSLYPEKGRKRKPLCQQNYARWIYAAGDRAVLHETICSPLRSDGLWTTSDEWNRGYIFGLADYLAQRRWEEKPPAKPLAADAWSEYGKEKNAL